MNDEEAGLYARAIRFCISAHKGQERKYTGEPYWCHPVGVSNILLDNVDCCNIDMVVAALLHDVVEDTKITANDISHEFGEYVARLVEMLTDVSKPEDGNRKKRKELDRAHLANASNEAKTIKLADLIDNSNSIIEHDKEFAKVYMEEKKLLLEVLTGGSEILMEKAQRIVNNYFEGK